MAITIGQFKEATARLAGDTPLRLRGDGKGLATTTWQRFEVGFCDLFRSHDTIAKQQRATCVAFLAAAREAYGERGLALSLPAGIDSQSRSLSVRAVKATIENAEARGSQYDTRNKLNIRQAAYGTRAGDLTLPQLLEAGREPVLAQALKEGRIDQARAAVLRLQYSLPVADGDPEYVILEPISQDLEQALLKASEIGPGYYRLLKPAEMSRIGQTVVGRRLAAEIDPDWCKQWEQRDGLQQASQALGAFADALGGCQTLADHLTQLLELTRTVSAIPVWQQQADKGNDNAMDFSTKALETLAADPAGLAQVNTLKQFWSQEVLNGEPVGNALVDLGNDPPPAPGAGPASELPPPLPALAKAFGWPGSGFYQTALNLAVVMMAYDAPSPRPSSSG